MPTPGMAARTDSIRSLSYTSITSSYVVIGAAFDHSMRKIRFVNNTNGDMFFSDDGANDKWFVPASSSVSYDYTTNSHLPEGVLVYPQHTQMYVRQSTAASANSIYIECTYAQGQ